MTNDIAHPNKGESPKVSWGIAVTDACNSMRAASYRGTLVRDGAGAFGNAPGPVNERNRRNSMVPHAFEVRWNGDLNDGAGGWMVFVPNEQVVMFNGEYLTPGGITQVDGIEGWYSVDDATKQSTSIFVNISSEDGVDDASLSSVESGDVSVCLAVISYQAETYNDDAKASVSQSVVGSISISSGKDTDNKSTGTNNDSKIEVNGWKTKASESQTIAGILDSSSTDSIAVVVRDGGPDGVLKYIPIGQFSRVSSSSSQPTAQVIGDIMYDVSDHKIKKRVDTINLRTGAVTQGNWEMITGGQATPHSGEPI